MIDIQALTSYLDNEVLVRKYLDRFATDMPELLHLIRTTSRQHQWNELQLHAHTFKCQFQYINTFHAAIAAHELEQACAVAEPDQEQIDSLIARLEDYLAQALLEIKQLTG